MRSPVQRAHPPKPNLAVQAVDANKRNLFGPGTANMLKFGSGISSAVSLITSFDVRTGCMKAWGEFDNGTTVCI